MYWAFHWGIAARREFPVLAPRGAPRALAELGELVRLELVGGGVVEPRGGRGRPGPVWLATDDGGGGLWLVARGGVVLDQGAPLGRIVAVSYRTRKDSGGTRWRHAFEGTLPELVVDADGVPRIRRAGSRFRVTWRGIVG